MAKIIYTKDLPNGIGGRCEYPFFPKWGKCTIKIHPKHKTDGWILAHELKHEEQYKRTFFHALLYKYSRNYRYKAELEAYTEQIREYGYTNIINALWIVKSLTDKYNLKKQAFYIHQDVEKIIENLKGEEL